MIQNEILPVAPVQPVVLLPCPFCGDRAKLVEADALTVWYVYCECCAARHEATTKQRVIVAWNNRRANGLVNWLDAEFKKSGEVDGSVERFGLPSCRRTTLNKPNILTGNFCGTRCSVVSMVVNHPRG